MENIINTICELGKKTDTKVYVVGGFIRDFLVKKKTCDFDIAVSKSPDKFAALIAKKIGGKNFLLHDSDIKTYRVALYNSKIFRYIDVSLIAGKTIEDDLKKRDFTVNAMAVDIEKFGNLKKNITDICNGLKDIRSKQINIVSDKSFENDPLRMLRAFRIAAEYNFNISKKTLASAKKHSAKIKNIAGERIKNELFRILSLPKSSQYIAMMDDIKLLETIFPVISVMKKSAKKFYYHPKGLFQHCFQTLESLENILSKLDKYFPDSKDLLTNHLNQTFSENVSRTNLLKFIALMHDCAKPECAKKMDGKMRFLGHEEFGAKKTAEMMKNLKMSNKEINFAKAIISEHMRPSNLAKSEIITNRAKMRLYRDMKENTPDILILAMSDWHSYKTLKIYSKKVLAHQEQSVAGLISDYFDFLNNKPKGRILDGNTLMKNLSLQPGKLVGEILKAVNSAYEEGHIGSQKQALAFAKLKLTQLKKKK